MSLFDGWDTALVLTVVLAPMCMILLVICLNQWSRINHIHHNHQTALAELAEMRKVYDKAQEETTTSLSGHKKNHDDEIQRQKDEIVKLHNKIKELETDLKYFTENGEQCGSD